jgi:transcriptional antiterminator NusG
VEGKLMLEQEGKSWYVLFVVTGDEDNVKERLTYKLKLSDLKVVVLKRRLRERKGGIWITKIRTLFPGYILLNGEIKIREYELLKNVPGVIRLLGDNSKPVEISWYEMDVIKRLICNNEIIGCSSIKLDNQNIIVIDGPLLGLNGYIESIDKRKGRAKVRLNLMGEPRVVELSIAMVQSVS